MKLVNSKSILKIVFSFLSLVLLLLSADRLVANSAQPSLKLTPEEQLWLSQHPTIKIAFDGYFPPYSYFESDKSTEVPVGITVNTLNLIAERLQIKFEMDQRSVWKDIYQAGIDREVDIIATMVDRKDRHAHFNFTKPYVFKSMVIIANRNAANLKSREDLSNKTVALVTDYQYSNRVITEFPEITPYYVDSMHDALLAVETQQVDAAIIYLAAGIYLQHKYGFAELQFAAHYDKKTANESIAVRSDWPLLTGILQKGLDSISTSDQVAINQEWQTQLKVPVDYSRIFQLAAGFILVVFALLIWVIQIRNRNKQIQTTQVQLSASNVELTKLKSTLEDEVVERTSSLLESESKYRHLVENLEEEYFFYQRDSHGNYLYASPSVTILLGYTVDYFLQNGHTIFTDNTTNIHSADLSKSNHLSNSSCRFEIELVHSNGEHRQFHVLENVSRDSDGNYIGVEGIAQDITQLKETQAALNWLSHYDDLTELANRRLFLIQCEHMISLAHRQNEKLALLFLDLDRFKIINDNMGHFAGDIVLKEAANRIRSTLRDSDLAARIGGDEFTIILTDCNQASAKKVASKISASICRPFVVNGQFYELGVSIGIAMYPDNGSDPSVLIQQADSAMYRAKKLQSGIEFSSLEQQAINNRQMRLEQSLRSVFKKNCFDDTFEMQAYYQPKYNIETRRVCGYEALIRWKHPELGEIPPSEFVPIAEASGLIGHLTEWMIRRVCRQAKIWHEQSFPFFKIAVNISTIQLINLDLAESLIDFIITSGAQKEWFEIEVTESALMKAPDVAVSILTKLKAAGILVAIDDFGTGYSSLSYLKNLPADFIKIDRSFISNVLDSVEDQEVVRAIIAMSHALGKKVIAEGVENELQLQFLQQHHCDMAQGFWFSKAVPADQLTSLLKNPDAS